MRAPRRDPGRGEIPMRQNALPEDAFPCSGRRGQIRTEPRTIDTNTKAVVCPKTLGRLLLKRRLTMKEIKRGEIYRKEAQREKSDAGTIGGNARRVQ